MATAASASASHAACLPKQTGRTLSWLAPDFKTIANFRVDNHTAVVRVCQAFVQFCRSQALFGGELVAIDGSKFQADSSPAKVTRQTDLAACLAQVDRQIAELAVGPGAGRCRLLRWPVTGEVSG